MSLLLLEKATPRELIICTFTEKAAFELRDRISAAARRVGYSKDLSELRVSTIHGLCNRLLTTYRHHTPLGNNYETLDELTQLLFIFDNFDAIVGAPVGDRFLGKWKTKWTAIEGVRGYFDKITEELVEPDQLVASSDPFLQGLGLAYKAYRQALLDGNRLDFAHQQKARPRSASATRPSSQDRRGHQACHGR
jgi:DNA helicase-2/ATP-dependent DNA helicase PcrA